jgi:16S rRNA (guanine527-N7)-methyltransferase
VAGERPREQLDKGLDALGLGLSDPQIEALMGFLALLAKWSGTYRLTAVTHPPDMVSLHLLDSLSVLPYLAGPRIADVGTGPGLPGIPLAVARPDDSFLLLDSNGKKTRFVTHAVGFLSLSNVDVVKARVEDYADDLGFDTVISRAFSSLADFARLAGHLCAPGGRLLAMKGRLHENELAALPEDWRIAETRALGVPGVSGQRHLVVLERVPRTVDR